MPQDQNWKVTVEGEVFDPNAPRKHQMVPDVVWSACCKEMQDAMGPGTDNEGYGALCSVDNGRPQMGVYGLTPISLCPWCGAALEIHPNSEEILRDRASEALGIEML